MDKAGHVGGCCRTRAAEEKQPGTGAGDFEKITAGNVGLIARDGRLR
jgi:hypothetical protein